MHDFDKFLHRIAEVIIEKKQTIFPMEYCLDRKEIALRFIEEAFELAYAAGVTRDDIIMVHNYIQAKDSKDHMDVEIGQVQLVLAIMSYLHAEPIIPSLNNAVVSFLTWDPELLKEKHRKKVELKIAVPFELDEKRVEAALNTLKNFRPVEDFAGDK